VRKKSVILKKITDGSLLRRQMQVLRNVGPNLFLECDFSPVESLEAGNTTKNGGLPGAGGPEKDGHLRGRINLKGRANANAVGVGSRDIGNEQELSLMKSLQLGDVARRKTREL
jgi:hypothetical protein